MIVKSNDLTKIKKEDYKIILLYGENNGLKEEVINKLINKSSGELSKFDESEIIENYESFLVELLNKSLFFNSKIIIISRVTYKIISFIEEVLERNIDGIKIFLNAGNFFSERIVFVNLQTRISTSFSSNNIQIRYL